MTEFKKDSQRNKIDFPATLNAFERALIHEIADELGGLTHLSEGMGKQRHIVVTKIKELSEEKKEEQPISEPQPKPV